MEHLWQKNKNNRDIEDENRKSHKNKMEILYKKDIAFTRTK